MGKRNEQDNENVDHQKPGGQQRELGGYFEQRAIGVEQDRAEAEERPDCQHRQDGVDEPMQSAGQPGGVTLLPLLSGLPAKPVDVAADEEEDRHHLEEPGQPAGPGDEGERVGGHQLPVRRRIEGDDQPVADDDDADGGGAQEVDVAVAFGRGLGGETGGVCPDGEVDDGLQGLLRRDLFIH